MDLGQKIKELRLKKSMSQEDLGAIINKATSSVKKYEGGQTAITVDLLQDISAALDVTVASMIIDEDDLFKLFIDTYNLHTIDSKELATLEIEFKFIMDYLAYKYDHTK